MTPPAEVLLAVSRKIPRQAVEKWTEEHCPLSHSHYCYYVLTQPRPPSLESLVVSYQVTTLVIPERSAHPRYPRQ
jgi:hypothetical protein